MAFGFCLVVLGFANFSIFENFCFRSEYFLPFLLILFTYIDTLMLMVLVAGINLFIRGIKHTTRWVCVCVTCKYVCVLSRLEFSFCDLEFISFIAALIFN